MAEPSKLDPLPPEDWDPRLGSILDDMAGRPLNVHRLMAHNPGLLRAWWDFRNYSVSGGGLSARHRELVILRVAYRLRCWYEWASHVARGAEAGLTPSEIARVEAGPTHADWSASESVLLQAVDDCLDDHAVHASTRVELERHFEPAQILDVIAIQGMYGILATMIGTWGLPLDASVRLPEGVSWPDGSS